VNEQELLSRLRAAKGRHEAMLLQKANVVGVAIGLRTRDGVPYGEPGLIVSVTHKVAWDELQPEDRIPRNLDGIQVWVEAIGKPAAQPEASWQQCKEQRADE